MPIVAGGLLMRWMIRWRMKEKGLIDIRTPYFRSSEARREEQNDSARGAMKGLRKSQLRESDDVAEDRWMSTGLYPFTLSRYLIPQSI